MERITVGKVSTELLQKDIYADHSAGEQMQENLSSYEDEFYRCLSAGKNNYSTDFYIVVITKREKLMPNVIRNYFIHRRSCPTPTYDQIVYKFNKKDEKIDFLWVLPAKNVCYDIKKDAHLIDISQQALLHYVLDFFDGTLDALARSYNNEPIPKKE